MLSTFANSLVTIVNQKSAFRGIFQRCIETDNRDVKYQLEKAGQAKFFITLTRLTNVLFTGSYIFEKLTNDLELVIYHSKDELGTN